MAQADGVSITVVVDNWVDMLLDSSVFPAEPHCAAHRHGLIEHFDPKLAKPRAEFGLALWVESWSGNRRTCTLFDCGLTADVLLHNLALFGLDPGRLDAVVISHGHPDHFGGIYELLNAIGRQVPVILHPEAFLPRWAIMGDGGVAAYYNSALQVEQLRRSGGSSVLTRDPVTLGQGVTTTGEIPRLTDFEAILPTDPTTDPGLYRIDDDGRLAPDPVLDEQGLVIDVADVGLIVLTGCAHAGVINTIYRSRELAPSRPIAAAFGGFHLGFPTTPTENVMKTSAALSELAVGYVMPMHCSGLRAHANFSTGTQFSYLQPAVGTTVTFGVPQHE